MPCKIIKPFLNLLCMTDTAKIKVTILSHKDIKKKNGMAKICEALW